MLRKRKKLAGPRRNFPLPFFMSTFYNVATKVGEVGESVNFSTSIPGKGAAPHDREYEHTLDAKGRLAIPARLRDELGRRFFM
jgi:hypothetical protein